MHRLLFLGLGGAFGTLGKIFVVHGQSRLRGAAMIAVFPSGSPLHARSSSFFLRL
jgi:hypothetical protein